jgi:hypothetical protein
MGVATLAAAAVTLLSAIVVARYLPARHRERPDEALAAAEPMP